MRRALFISDLQIPFEASHALAFVKAVVKEFRIPRTAIYNVGDEVDAYWGGLWEKDPEAQHTTLSELEDARRRLRKWYAAFPEMKLATSNHGQRWVRKAAHAGIPASLLKAYRDILEAPPGWQWRDHWTITMAKAPVHLFHGVGYSGPTAYRQVAIDKGTNVVFGHLHANAGIAHVTTDTGRRWGMNVGCLIDAKAYAFNYAKHSKFQPWLGVGVVVDGGMTPLLVPYERF
jgi:hypothetical protein